MPKATKKKDTQFCVSFLFALLRKGGDLNYLQQGNEKSPYCWFIAFCKMV